MVENNKARNFAITEALRIFENISWIFPLDGNNFVNSEGLSNILRGLMEAEKDNYIYHSVLMFRAISCQEHIITDKFSGLKIFSEMSVFHYLTKRLVSNYITKKDEGQVIISAKAPNLKTTFQSEFVHPNDDKYHLIKLLKKNPYCHEPSCLVANYMQSSSSPSNDANKISRCGYVIRLQYWPEKNCSKFNESNSNLPEVSSKLREYLRRLSLNKLQVVR